MQAGSAAGKVLVSVLKDICFTTTSFDRQSLKRSDKHWVSKQLNAENSVFLLFWKSCFLFDNNLDLSLLNKTVAETYSNRSMDWKYLGDLAKSGKHSSGSSVFGAEITDLAVQAEQANWLSLRRVGLCLPAEQANLLVYTQGLLNWHSSHQFCNYCGAKLTQIQAGHALKCCNDDCAKELFPRTDPAVIVLVLNEDSCLLGRQAAWPEKMFSCLAGFIETGENIEAAVCREVYEESGLELTQVIYRGSQPWPFPQSLMLGFHAQATNRELTFHDGEIQQAHWYNRQQLIKALERDELRLATPYSISYHLIEDWFNSDSDVPLKTFLKQ